jgi:membrane protease subunit HflC
MIAAIVGFVLLICVWSSVFMVRQQEQAMVVALGRVVRLVDSPGLHVKVPFYEQLVYFDKRILTNDSPSEEVQTLDKERVIVDSFTRWQIVDAGAFYRNVRSVPQAMLRLDTIINSNIREALGQVKLADLVGKGRLNVMQQIVRQSSLEAAPMGIRIVDVRLKRADLPQANSEAVFRRMRAERQKEASQLRAEGDEESQKIRAEAERTRTVMLAEAQRDSQKLWGEGEAAAIEITGGAFNRDPGFYRLTRSLEAYKAAFAPSNTIMVIDPSSDFMRTLMNP